MFGKKRICPECNGKGNITILDEKMCVLCQGTGRNLIHPSMGVCHSCQGTGKIKYYGSFICGCCYGNGYLK